MRSIHESPFSPLQTQAFHNVMLGFWLAMLLGRDAGIWGVVFLVVAMLLGVSFTKPPPLRPRPVRQAHRGASRRAMVLPFGSGHAPLDHQSGNEPSDELRLRDTLLQHGVGIATLDGSRISTWTELARELEAAYGPMRFPSEPRRQVPQHPEHRARQTPAPQSPALASRFAHGAHQSCIARRGHFAVDQPVDLRVVPFLLLLDMPRAEEPPIERPTQPIVRAKGSSDEEPAMAELASAPSDSWWKPKPGEMSP